MQNGVTRDAAAFAAAAFTLTCVFQLLYCRKPLASLFRWVFKGEPPATFPWCRWVLTALSVAFTIAGVVLGVAASGGIGNDPRRSLAAWKATSVVSIGLFEIIEVTFESWDVLNLLGGKKFEFINRTVTWGDVIQWTAIACQLVYTGLGAWQLHTSGPEFFWAVPAFSHLVRAIAAVQACRLWWSSPPKARWRLGGVAGVMILVVLASGLMASIPAARGWDGHQMMQCFLCMMVIFEKSAWTRWKNRRGGEMTPIGQLAKTRRRASSLPSSSFSIATTGTATTAGKAVMADSSDGLADDDVEAAATRL